MHMLFVCLCISSSFSLSAKRQTLLSVLHKHHMPFFYFAAVVDLAPFGLALPPPPPPSFLLARSQHAGKKLHSVASKRVWQKRTQPEPQGPIWRSRDLPTSLLVRNLRHDCRPDDLRRPFAQFGALKDIYLPRDYYTGKPRGFGFIQYVDPADAADAKYHMDGYVLHGRELTVVFAEENRKKPVEMRQRERGSRGSRYDHRRSPPRYSLSPRCSRSPPPRHARSRSRSQEYYSPAQKRRHSRSHSPLERRGGRDRSRTPPRQSRERSYSQSPPMNGSRSRSRSPIEAKSRSPSRSRSLKYSRDVDGGERSPSP